MNGIGCGYIGNGGASTFCSFGVNFTNVLRTAFTLVDLKSVKKIENLTVFFTLLGSAHVKAARRPLVKFSLGVVQRCRK
jgi:hypothetical protein